MGAPLPGDPHQGEANAYLSGAFATVWREVDALEATEDPVTTPHASKYAALKKLQGLRASAPSPVGDSPRPERLALALAALAYRRGQLFIAAEQPPDGEKELEDALCLLQRGAVAEAVAGGGVTAQVKFTSPLREVLLQTCFNALGNLWCTRGENARAAAFFDRAEAFGEEGEVAAALSTVTAGGETSQPAGEGDASACTDAETLIARSLAGDNPGGGGEAEGASYAAAPASAAIAAARATAYTQTLFLQAQVQGALGRSRRAAGYCAATLRRQLAAAGGGFGPGRGRDAYEWAQNAAQLAGYYVVSGRRGEGGGIAHAPISVSPSQCRHACMDMHVLWP